MYRLLLWLGLAYILLRLLRGGSKRTATSQQNSLKGEEMVKCDTCGVYVPRHEAINGGWRHPGRLYCSEHCRRQQ